MSITLDFSIETFRESQELIQGANKRLFDKAKFIFSSEYCIPDSMHKYLKDSKITSFSDYGGEAEVVDFAYTIVSKVVGIEEQTCIAFPLFTCTNSCGNRSYESFTTCVLGDNVKEFIGVIYILVDDLKTRYGLYELNDVYVRAKETIGKILRLLDDVSFHSKYKYNISIRKNGMSEVNKFHCARAFEQEEECLRHIRHMLGELLIEYTHHKKDTSVTENDTP